MQINQLLRQAALELSKKSTTAVLDSEILLAHVLQQKRSYLYINHQQEITDEQIKHFLCLVKQRSSGKPIAYLTKFKEFWNLNLAVDENVLIPRPETELLVEVVLNQFSADELLKVADLGTGSGAIALAIAKERPAWKVVATDKSEAVLQVAKNNALRLEISNLDFVVNDWCQLNLPFEKFDIIVSNPPYIEVNAKNLSNELQFEPEMALFAGIDGLDAFRQIIGQAKKYLDIGGSLILEHGYNQANSVRKIFETNGYSNFLQFEDLAGIERTMLGIV